jgi:hypothetical protein
MEKLIFFLFHGERMPALLEVPEYQFSVVGFFFYWVRDFFIYYVYFFKGRASGEKSLGANLERAGLALLDAWSDGNATPHDRLSPLEEGFAVGLAETWLFLWPFLSRF